MRRHVVAFAVMVLAACSRQPSTGIIAHGTIEVIETDVSPMATARLLRIPVEEGDAVRPGDTLAILTQATLAATLDGHRARLAAAEAALRDLERGARPEEVAAAEAELSGAESDVARTTRDLERARALVGGQAISQQAVDNASDAVATAVSRRDAARERLALLRAGARPERVRQARAEVSTARAALAAAEANAADLVLLCPVQGVVFERYAQAGEVLTPGSPALTVGEVSRPWVRVFLAARDVARIKLGQSAVVTLDGVPGRQYPGVVTVINPRAEFTPRAALTEEEREDLMFGVRIDVQDTTGAVKPGLPHGGARARGDTMNDGIVIETHLLRKVFGARWRSRGSTVVHRKSSDSSARMAPARPPRSGCLRPAGTDLWRCAGRRYDVVREPEKVRQRIGTCRSGSGSTRT